MVPCQNVLVCPPGSVPCLHPTPVSHPLIEPATGWRSWGPDEHQLVERQGLHRSSTLQSSFF